MSILALLCSDSIDALVLVGRGPEAIRRYRELMRATWDEAIHRINGWVELTRTQKLALLGWVPNNTKKVDESEMADHPLRDPLLDG